MSAYISPALLKELREQAGLTQKQLAEKLTVSDKAISKWETGRGLPDITLLEPLSAALGISTVELLSGKPVFNRNRSGNLLKGNFYLCPVCGNVLFSCGEALISCCGITLPPLAAENEDEEHRFRITPVEDELYVQLDHPMSKSHYITFLAFVSTDRLQLVKLYPEQDAAARFKRQAGGCFYAACNHHGLFRVRPGKTGSHTA